MSLPNTPLTISNHNRFQPSSSLVSSPPQGFDLDTPFEAPYWEDIDDELEEEELEGNVHEQEEQGLVDKEDILATGTTQR